MSGRHDVEAGAHRRKRHAAEAPRAWLRRIGWFVFLWAASVVCVGLVAYAIRMMVVP